MEMDHTSQKHVPIKILPDDHVNLVSSIKEKLANVLFLHCVCRVPEGVSKDNNEKYFPKLVSIGPYHRGKDHLKPMDDRKWIYLKALLGREPIPNATLEACVKTLQDSERAARNFYGEYTCMGSDEFVTMMLVDGFFIIELFLKFAIKGLRRRDDLLFASAHVFFRLRCDLILLENQVPFFVLLKLFYHVHLPKQLNISFHELAFCFFRKALPSNSVFLQEKLGQEFSHFLDLIHQCYLPTHSLGSQSSGLQRSIHNVTKLREAGVRFKSVIAESLLDLSFAKGVLKIPTLRIHNYTEVLFRNFIALEQCPGCTAAKCFTSYALLLKDLIQSGNDLKFLCQRGIWDGYSRNVEDVMVMFKSVEVELELKEFCYGEICGEVNGFRRPPRGAIWFKEIRHLLAKLQPDWLG